MNRKILVIAGWIAIGATALVLVVVKPDLTKVKDWFISFYENPVKSISSLNLDGILKQVQEIQGSNKTSTPPPIRSIKGSSSNTALTVNGTIAATNKERTTRGLAALTVNPRLTLSAEDKIADMFKNQYFEHVSPSGVGPAELATSVGYEYVWIGENLALGNFSSDADLVTAWMNSPGHRANILNSRYMEIGVAVKRGYFEGELVWLAVQEFGKPMSSCPAIDASLKATIQANQDAITALNQELDQKRAELDAYTPKNSPEYNQKVDEYNALVVKYNNLIEETKSLISEYNTEVEAFNACAQA